MKNSKKKNYWPLKITVAAFIISILIGMMTNAFIDKVELLVSFVILLLVIFLGIIFDIIGISVTISEETPFHSRSTRGYKGGREAIKLIRNADKVSSFCNDVIGDIAGVISGGLAAAIAVNIFKTQTLLSAALLNLLLTAIVSALTVGGKAIGKGIAIKHGEDIVLRVSLVVYYFKKVFAFNLQKKER